MEFYTELVEIQVNSLESCQVNMDFIESIFESQFKKNTYLSKLQALTIIIGTKKVYGKVSFSSPNEDKLVTLLTTDRLM